MIASTMQDGFGLTVPAILRHARGVHAASRVVTWDPEAPRRATVGEVAERALRLADGLAALGVRPGEAVATLAWNTQEHLEAYFAVPAMSGVLHTLNLRLSRDQIRYVMADAADAALIVDASLVKLMEDQDLRGLRAVIVVGEPPEGLPPGALRYEDVVAAGEPRERPEPDERAAAAMCHTTGTTGDPKGVVYSHRSTYLHALTSLTAAGLGLREDDRVLPVVPMFHASAWGLPYSSWMIGADLVLPGPHLGPAALARMIGEERVTLTAAVPTLWTGLLEHLDAHPADLSSLRSVACGGAAVPPAMIRAFADRHGVVVAQGWGMTETSPIAAMAHPPKGTPPADAVGWRARSGRLLPGVEARVVGPDGTVAPADGESTGELEVRGPWVAAGYHGGAGADCFHDGWLRTGDIATLDGLGFVQICDRAKDVIKSGGEWISSLALEAALSSHPSVREAAVIAIPHPKWQERPLACVVLAGGAQLDIAALRAELARSVPRWWIPDAWAVIDAVPRTSVGKTDKKGLRRRHAEGLLTVHQDQVESALTLSQGHG